MLLANFNGKEHLRHRAVSLRQHGFLVHLKLSEVFEIWVLVLCPWVVSPSLITILPRDVQCSSTWWLTKWLLLAQCFTVHVSDSITFVFGIVRLQAARCPVVRDAWYRRYSRCADWRYFLLLRYTAVYRDFGATGIVKLVSTISIEVSRVSHNTTMRNCAFEVFAVFC